MSVGEQTGEDELEDRALAVDCLLKLLDDLLGRLPHLLHSLLRRVEASSFYDGRPESAGRFRAISVMLAPMPRRAIVLGHSSCASRL